MSRLPAFLSTGIGQHPAQGATVPVVCGSFGLISRSAPWAWSLVHARKDHVLLWITHGQGRCVIDGIRRGISAHTAVFVPAGSLWSVDLSSGTTALYLQTPPCGAGTGRGTPTPSRAEPSPAPLPLPQRPLLLRVRTGAAQAELTGLIDSMVRECDQQRPFYGDALDAYLHLLAVWMRRQVAEGADDPGPSDAAAQLVRRYATALVANSAAPQGMGEHARALAVTPTHLSRCCKALAGLTASDLLADCRLHAARAALCRPDPPVSEIARALGFATPAYFTRFIKTRTGHAPTALRRISRMTKPHL
ncbi:helix-turn-helix domain-containing protein [Cognatishimia sp. F0-27]|uniref:helix-turn-helix domain-containing protein n=1 Tax=Cognatishimia sp. F0-27 TaxID=2816855 RepID=UPI001D0C9B3D|nr:helix-turn-helix domain-containing protein [Cognatishimia sp. F0-27]MCC1493572.1 helix-turn-helix domain-containing protein [Cognatishimia sp. F0-27]